MSWNRENSREKQMILRAARGELRSNPGVMLDLASRLALNMHGRRAAQERINLRSMEDDMAVDRSIIPHHFDEPPFSKKIRLIFGLKQIGWSSTGHRHPQLQWTRTVTTMTVHPLPLRGRGWLAAPRRGG
jgi:hypothetical protein